MPLITLERGASVDAVRRRLAGEFRAAGLDAPELDARLLVGLALGLDHAALVAQSARALTLAESDAVAGLAARRLAREPIARIVGRKEFWGLSFRLNAETLVPRPETETLVEAALDSLEHARLTSLRIADLGIGSGALLLSLLTELPAAVGIGTDLSLGALHCARNNAADLGVATRTSLVVCNYADALCGPFDLIVCNPPYVAHSAIATLAPEVRDFDPRRALDGGRDGLDGYRVLAAEARRLLAPGGICIVELGVGQSEAVGRLFRTAGLTAVEPPRRDLSGVERALVVKALP